MPLTGNPPKQKNTIPTYLAWKWAGLFLILLIPPIIVSVLRQQKSNPLSCAPFPELHPRTSRVPEIKGTTLQGRRKFEWALEHSCSSDCLQIVFDSNSDLTVKIISPDEMKKLVGRDAFDAAFAPDLNTIFINTYLLEHGREDHLVTQLANEMSHALTQAVNNKLAATYKMKGTYKSFSPWHNEKQKAAVIEAYNKFLNRLGVYEHLASKPNLTKKEKAHVSQYHRAILDYIPPRRGKNGWNANQDYLEVTNDNGKPKFTHLLNPDNILSKDATPLTRARYYRQNLQRDMALQNLMYQYSDSAVNSKHSSDEQFYADKISDFAMLAPTMQKLLGPELCETLNNLYLVDDICDRPWPPNFSLTPS